MRSSIAFVTLAAATAVNAYSVPANLAAIYNNHKAGKCGNKLVGGFDDGYTAYCGDINGAIFLHRSKNGGQYDDMDIDCDGANRHAGACANDPSGQSITAFQDEVSHYGINDLDANVHPYVVFGNEDGNPSFNPQQYGMEPLSVMAVVCNNQLFYGVWGDTNGGTLTGESSLAMANLCFPNDGLNGNSGHGDHDVLYIGFTSKAAKPGASGANWKASNTADFEASIRSLGNSLVAKLS